MRCLEVESRRSTSRAMVGVMRLVRMASAMTSSCRRARRSRILVAEVWTSLESCSGEMRRASINRWKTYASSSAERGSRCQFSANCMIRMSVGEAGLMMRAEIMLRRAKRAAARRREPKTSL